MHASMWFEFFDGLFWYQNMCYMRGKCDNKEGYLNWAHPFPRVLEYKRGVTLQRVTLRRLGCIIKPLTQRYIGLMMAVISYEEYFGLGYNYDLTFKYVYLDSYMNFEQLQPPIGCTLHRTTRQMWWLANMKYKHSKLRLLSYCFWCYSCLMFLSPQVHIPHWYEQVVHLNILNC